MTTIPAVPRIGLDGLTAVTTRDSLRAGLTPAAPSPLRPSGRTIVPHNKRRETADPAVWARIKDHPCYSEEAHHYFARMHVAVAPGCNIQCNYCNRKYDCANESRPGVVSARLTPEQAIARVQQVAAQVPQLSVVGVAGPGDALFNARATLATFEGLRAALPDLTLCLSTNGLALADHVDALAALDIGHVTITINALDPAIGAEIYPWVAWGHRRLTGRDAAACLLDRQMEGLDRAVAAGLLVKVNSVMIPGINDAHLSDVNREVRARGAFLHNVMPLISDPAHGTRFGLEGRRGPTAVELHDLRESLGNDARLMRHCRQCRADAVGMLDEDACATPLDTAACAETASETDSDDARDSNAEAAEARATWRALVDDTRADAEVEADRADARVRAVAPPGDRRLVAVCSRGSGRVNLPFGKATSLHVYAVGADGIDFVGIRRLDSRCGGGCGTDGAAGLAEAARLDGVLRTLADAQALVAVTVGTGARTHLEAGGLAVHTADDHPLIPTAIADWYVATVAGSGRSLDQSACA